MTTFSKATFDAASYLAFRPSYPLWLYDEVLAFHRTGGQGAATRAGAHFRSAWDLGCGPGISSVPLQAHFARVTGLEPSANMVASAIRIDEGAVRRYQREGGAARDGSSSSSSSSSSSLAGLPAPLRTLLLHKLDTNARAGANATESKQQLGTIDYIQGFAEDLDTHCAPGSADLIVAGQAAHWFHYDRLWPVLSRALAPGGTVAFWGYAEFGLPDFPSTGPLISAFMSDPAAMGDEARAWLDKDKGVTNVGAYFERPGRTILDRGLVDVPWPWEVKGQGKADAGGDDKWDRASATRSMYSLAQLSPASRNPAWPAPNAHAESAEHTMDLVVDWSGLERYLRTASAVNNFLQQHPDDAARHGGRDVVMRFVELLKEQVPRGIEQLRLRWPLSLMMLKAKST
ncbi:trans-aconitate methyltransferase 1 [Tilletia horrida]|nr:trans-aconitate methyltransferase 1 [Tilletia horrida]